MRYPSIATDQIQRLQEQLAAGEIADIEEVTRWNGGGGDVDLGPISAAEFAIRASWDAEQESGTASVPDTFEATAAIELHQALAEIETEVLDDPGFWRYLTVKYFWWLVEWRERSAFDSGDWARIRVYVDGTRPAECVLLRMYLRARIALDGGGYELATAVPKATDLWRSHIVRVRTSYAPALAAELVRSQAADRMSTDELRSFARRLNRTGSNVVLVGYDQDDAAGLIADLRDS